MNNLEWKYRYVKPITKENVVRIYPNYIVLRTLDGREFELEKSLFVNFKLPYDWCTENKVFDFFNNIGEDCVWAKLTEKNVLEIRKIHYWKSEKENNTSLLAKRFGVTNSAIRKIISRKTWKHI